MRDTTPLKATLKTTPYLTKDALFPFLNLWFSGGIKTWISAVLVGQWMFGIYILFRFTLPWLFDTIDESQFTHMIRGYKNGETFNNAILLLHVIPVMVISMSATLQLVPAIRNRYRKFHRWNGRLFLTVGFFGAISGLYMTWGIGSRLSDIGAIGVTLNGLLILPFVYFTWRTAVKKQFTLHRRLAVHVFILINGVWSVRLYLMSWYMINQGPYGNTSNIDGPADIAISFASYLLPMAIAELAFWAEKRKSPKALFVGAVGVSVIAIITAIGVFAASSMMWLPRVIEHL